MRLLPFWAALLHMAVSATAEGGKGAKGPEPALPVSPSEYSVLRVGSSDSVVRVDAYIDLACADTQTAWPTLKKVMTTYEGKGVEFRYHLFPLPYHTFAFYLAKAAVIIAAKTNATSTYTFFDTCFAYQQQILNGPTANKTPTEVKAIVKSWAMKGTGLSEADFEHGWTDDYLEMNTRYEFKFTASRGVIGTPTFFINQMFIPGLASNSPVKTWSAYIDPLAKAATPKLRMQSPIDASLSLDTDNTREGHASLDLRSVLVSGGFLILVVGLVLYASSRQALRRRFRVLQEGEMVGQKGLRGGEGEGEEEGVALMGNERRRG